MLRYPPVDAILTKYDIAHFPGSEAEIKFLCPFHQHTGHSRHNASINRYSGKWCCYSCGANGTIVKFVADWNSVSHAAARRILKKDFEYDAEEAIFFDDEEKAEFTGIQFMRLPKKYMPIRYNDPYIAENNYDFAVLQQLDVGYDLTKEDGRFTHRNQFILPYMYQGQCVGWVYKILDGKYLFPPGFKKKKFLYAYDYGVMKNSVYIVEGQRDVWRLRSFGLNAVGLGGSDLSDFQVNMILNSWHTVHLCFDGDNAGRKVTRRAIDELAGMITKVRVITMPEGMDPNNLLTLDELNKLPIVDAKYWRM